MRGIRGAITVDNNNEQDILNATEKLLLEMINRNNLQVEEIVSIIFTATEDLDQIYPAVAARNLGFVQVPLMCYQELSVREALKRCIRVMIYINRKCLLDEINHIYLDGAKKLRPDLLSD